MAIQLKNVRVERWPVAGQFVISRGATDHVDVVVAEVEGDSFTQDEVVNLAAQMLVAGTDTTRNQLAAAVEVFCHHPDQ